MGGEVLHAIGEETGGLGLPVVPLIVYQEFWVTTTVLSGEVSITVLVFRLPSRLLVSSDYQEHPHTRCHDRRLT